jgi:CubicO group peptidase (beta-lactamase class C family)
MDRIGRLDKLCNDHAASGKFGEVLLALETRAGDESYRFGEPARPFFIASATKLFTSALLARLRERGVVNWDEPFVRYLPGRDVLNLARVGAVDYTPQITVRQLLAHTSGLPDYFEGERKGGATT